MNVLAARPRVGATCRRGRPVAVAVVALTTATALVACAPGLVLEQSLRLVSVVHPDVSVSVAGAAVGWLRSKPSVGRVVVTDKWRDVVVFECDGIKASASLLDVLLRRCKGECVNVFVERPRVAAYDATGTSPTSPTSPTSSTPFSGELDVDGWLRVFVSDG